MDLLSLLTSLFTLSIFTLGLGLGIRIGQLLSKDSIGQLLSKDSKIFPTIKALKRDDSRAGAYPTTKDIKPDLPTVQAKRFYQK